MASNIVFDASVILAHLNNEPGAGRASAYLGDAMMCAVNYSEVVAKLIERGASLALSRAALSRYGLQVVPFDEDLAERAAALRPKTKAHGLSLGDRACLALGERLRLPVLTADRVWGNLGLTIQIEILR